MSKAIQWTFLAAIFLLMLGSLAAMFFAPASPPPTTRHETVESPETDESSTWRRYPPRTLDLPGVTAPKLVPASSVHLAADEVVIGVKESGQARAYLARAFHGDPAKHLVRDQLGEATVVVTHCDRNGCTRVFKAPSADVRVGGWTGEELELLVDDVRYPQDSQQIPLDDVSFVVTSWKQWRDENPGTLIYSGGSETKSQPLQTFQN